MKAPAGWSYRWARRRPLGEMASEVGTGLSRISVLIGLWLAQLLCYAPFVTIMAHRGPGVAAAATARGLALAAWEQRLGLFVEPRLAALTGAASARAALTWLYLWPHSLLLCVYAPLVAWRRRDALFPFVLRCWWAMGLGSICFFFLPVAPPRLLPPVAVSGGWVRFSDGLAEMTEGGPSFDQYAAFPSYHVAFAVIVLGTAMACWPGRASRILGLGYVAGISLVVVITANHFLADVLGGLALGALSGLGTRLSLRASAWARSRLGGQGWPPRAARAA